MIPGPIQVVACPHCGTLATYKTLTSGNTSGARVWTDGKQVAPMLPRPPAVVKCHHCAECYWLADAIKVGTFGESEDESKNIDPAWAAAPEVGEPSETDFYEALQKGLATDSQQERNLRVLAWWRRNDAFREGGHGQSVASASESCRKNLEALLLLLDEADENDLIMKAEVLRELGEFEAASQVLSRVTSEKFDAVVRQLRLLCEARDSDVKELQLDNSPMNGSVGRHRPKVMGIAFLAFLIELALGAGFWFIWKPLAFFFVVLAIGGLARHIAGRITSESRKMALVLAAYYVVVGLLLALAVYYGALLSGNGIPLKIGLGIWGLIGAQYAHVRKPGHFMGAAPAYILFILVLFLR